MNFRYFRITEGPVVDEVRRILAERKKISELLTQLERRIGAKESRIYNHSGKVAGFKFEQAPDVYVWRKPDRDGLYMPRKTSPTGKALHKEIEALPRLPSIQNALTLIDLPPHSPLTFDSGRCYFASLYGFPAKGVLFVRVPWRDIDPELIEEYRRDKETSHCFNAEYEHAMWTPTPEMVEVKEWEVLKEMDKDAKEVSP
ncbi:hypothetical protein RVM26_05020 [Halomonas sp. KM072]